MKLAKLKWTIMHDGDGSACPSDERTCRRMAALRMGPDKGHQTISNAVYQIQRGRQQVQVRITEQLHIRIVMAGVNDKQIEL